MSPAIEEPTVQRILESSNRSRQGWLSYVRLSSGKSEGTGLGDQQKVANRFEHKQRLSKVTEIIIGRCSRLHSYPCL